MNTGAKLLADCLVKQNVKYIFGIPGAKIDALFDALIDTPIEVIVCHHEQNAAFIAAAYGRLTGNPGVVLVTSGPGVSNLLTGLLTATTEGDPIVALGGNVSRFMKLKESHQSTNNVQLTKAATKKSMEITAGENIPEVIENAFRLAKAPRSGAVFVSIPQDLLSEEVKATPISPPPQIELGPASTANIEETAKLLDAAKNPVFLLGLEASRPKNTEAIRRLLQKTKIAVVSTYQAAGVISRELLDCFVGRVGLFKNQPGDKLLDDADLVITIGYSPVEYDPEVWNLKNAKKIIHIDYKPASIHSAYIPSIEDIGEIAPTLDAISSKLKERKEILNAQKVQKLQKELSEKIEARVDSGPLMHPLQFIHDLRKCLDDEAIVISDVGTHYMWLARYFLSFEPHRLLFSNGQQTLGIALPWAIAAKMLHPKSKVISISGDGGFLFSAMELETAVRLKLNFVHCIWCDGAYDMVRQQQLLKYHRETAVSFGPIDHVQFAESFGATGFRVNQPEEFLPLLEKAFSIEGPTILEIPIDYSHNKPLFEIVSEGLGN
ncbi:MAG: Acetolactate synthase [Chlamydiae bacterium]|nr:Acetolactate synthase [Chlamydiota bacterium]